MHTDSIQGNSEWMFPWLQTLPFLCIIVEGGLSSKSTSQLPVLSLRCTVVDPGKETLSGLYFVASFLLSFI